MTLGQRLALEQFEDIQRAGPSALDIVEVVPPSTNDQSLKIRVTVACGEMLRTLGGLPLRDRERLTIHVPPGFPFKYPFASVPHRRFAGFPHVLWGRQLCLYVSAATQWEASDGMYGFAARLDAWLRDAAQDKLDPEGAPAHPPYQRRISFDAPFFISRENTPAVADVPWIGYAQLRVVSERRIDIVGWSACGADTDELPSMVAAAVLLPGPLPWEFPETALELASELEQNGFAHSSLLLILMLAALGTPDGEPLYFVVGAKMRGIRGSSDLRQHLTVWRIPAVLANGLRLISHRFSDHLQLQEIGQEAQKLVEEWIDSARVEWCWVQEARPEIVVRRDFNTLASWFRGKTVAVWGCGALGGVVAEALARAGVDKLILRDNGFVSPGLLPRQPYDDADIGNLKVYSLTVRLLRIRSDLEIVPSAKDILSEPLEGEDWTDGADLVIDASASKAVLAKLERVRWRSKRRVPIVSMMIGPRSERGLVLVAGAAYSGGPADVARRAKLAACDCAGFKHFADEFWPVEARHEMFQPEPGCSAATFVGSWTDVHALGASMLNMAAWDLSREGHENASAHFLAQAHIPLTVHQLRQADFSWQSDVLFLDPQTGYEIRITPGAWKDLCRWIEKSRCLLGPEPETGGVLFGQRDDAAFVIWVSEVIGPPPDSSHSPDLFICGVQGMAEANQEKFERTRCSVAFIGSWHTHPKSPAIPSAIDFNGVSDLLLREEKPTPKILLLIIGGTARITRTWQAGAYVFSRREFEELRTGKTWRKGELREVLVSPEIVAAADLRTESGRSKVHRRRATRFNNGRSDESSSTGESSNK